MRGRLNFKVLAISVTLVVVVSCAMVLYSLTGRSKTDRGNVLTSLLEAPLFISSAEAQTADAFPADEAGIAAYVKVPAVDIEKIKPLLTKAEEVGDNHIVGITQIPDFGGTIGVHLYADTDGWLVAYLGADEPAAMIMQWGDADPRDPKIGVIQSTTLEDALYNAGDAAGAVVASRDIKYYDFECPEANGMALFIRTRTGTGANIVQVELPATYMLYEASYYQYIYTGGYRGESCELKVDESRISYLDRHGDCSRGLGSYKGAITTGALHKIEISVIEMGSAGVATVLIYKAQ